MLNQQLIEDVFQQLVPDISHIILEEMVIPDLYRCVQECVDEIRPCENVIDRLCDACSQFEEDEVSYDKIMIVNRTIRIFENKLVALQNLCHDLFSESSELSVCCDKFFRGVV